MSNGPSSSGICPADPTTAVTPCGDGDGSGRGVQADDVMSGLRQRHGMTAGSTPHIQHAADNTLASPALDRRPRFGAREVARSVPHADVAVIALHDF